jgi:alkyl sulfatase BDS1-like metallo-beta-lactamase superfamily hydrolase
MSLDFIFDYLGVRLNADKAAGKGMVINWVVSDLGRRYVMTLDNCALTYLPDRASDQADATVTLEREVLNRLILHETPFADAVRHGLVGVEGDPARVAELFSLLDDFTPIFEIIEPKPEP